MRNFIKKIHHYIAEIFRKNRYVEKNAPRSDFYRKVIIQFITAGAFLLLTIINIVTNSTYMLIFTAVGFGLNLISATLALILKQRQICAYTSIITCSILFGTFVIYGGNDGFACLWVVLLPFLSMVVMDFVVGFCASVFFQLFVIVVFWTPIKDMIFYNYNAQFCLRFPLFYLVTFLLGLVITISLRNNQYNEYMHQKELEQMNDVSRKYANIDPLTELANRRCAYEVFKNEYSEPQKKYCIVMCDIDDFKKVNDTYGHEVCDGILVTLSVLFRTFLPADYQKVRWGGEEFLFASKDCLEKVYAMMESLRQTIEKEKFDAGTESINITMTFGIIEYSGSVNVEKAINAADACLYKGKKENKNCVVVDRLESGDKRSEK